MAYCTYAEIEADFKNLEFDASNGNIIQADVTQFIVEADALIDSFVGKRYEVPVTAGTGLELLKFYSRQLVANRIKSILEVKQQGQRDANQNVRSGMLSTEDIMKALKAIADGKADLIGADLLIASGPFFSNNYSNSVCPTFKKDERQW